MDSAELRLLSSLLGVPDESALDTLREASTALRWLQAPVEELAQLPLDQWQGEHTRLFIAGYPHTPCAPFASAWVEQCMHGAPMEALQIFYRDLGLEATGIPADYLGTILECAALLAEAPERTELCKELWEKHLLPWLPHFTSRLMQESRLQIYRTLAQRLEDLGNEYRMAATPSGAP